MLDIPKVIRANHTLLSYLITGPLVRSCAVLEIDVVLSSLTVINARGDTGLWPFHHDLTLGVKDLGGIDIQQGTW